MKKNDILQQEPQTEAVAMENEPGSYVAYLNMDWLFMAFGDLGICHDTKKQEEFVEELQQKLEDVILQRKGRPGVAWSWMWQDAKGENHRAVEIIPVKAKVPGLQIVTPDVTGYQELRDKLKALELECAIQKRQINMLAEVLKTNNLISERGFRTCFDREPTNYEPNVGELGIALVWHPKTERPDDESQILIDEGDGYGTAGTYYADGDILATAADGISADWEDWHMDRWAYISDLVPKKEKEDRAI